ncbi:MAG: glycerophosphodiester phosphodiesterase [SAR324 cluster bacterium]|nr:glycerophosphodiester phosphodiesterase [SAR324 cluster bacterium]
MAEWLALAALLALLARGAFWLGQELRGWGYPPRADWELPLPPPILVAHRGGEGLYPENTLEAFQACVERHDCRFLELDVRCTRDGVPVVFHDATVERTTGGTGAVHEMTLAALQQLDAGRSHAVDPRGVGAHEPIRVPTLEAVFRALPQCWFIIEIKPDQPPCEAEVAAVIRRCGMSRRAIAGSSMHGRALRFRALAPELPTFFSRRSVLAFLLFRRLGLLGWYRPLHHVLRVPETYRGLRVVTPGVVAAAHRVGVPVFVCTVNDVARMRRLLGMGVDGIITGRPDRFAEALSQSADRPRDE